MTVPDQEIQNPSQVPAEKPSDKEINFRRAENYYKRQVEEERQARLEAERKYQEVSQRNKPSQDDDDDSESAEPYVDHKRLSKKLSTFEKRIEEKIEQAAEKKARIMIDQDKDQSWLHHNRDFEEVMEYAEKFGERYPDIAASILKMPPGFERQKLVYSTIKSHGMHKPQLKESTIQNKIDQNRQFPGYQPSNVSSAPYGEVADFSPQGQKQAYEKMQLLKKNIRL